MNRRLFLRSGGLLAATFATLPALKLFSEDMVTLPFTNGERSLVKYPQKRPLIRLTSRPPQLETPFSVFNEGVVTPNDAFFVRYHLSDIPLSIDPETFRLEIKGLVESPLTLSL
ncbi:MAG: oxidase, partial [Verrucomicrobiota bacterium]